jgi:anti-sigma factor RsiW
VNGHVRDRLSAYLDGELGADDREAVEAHLDGCPGCDRYLEELRAVDAAALEVPVEAPPGYFDTFPARVRARLPSPRSRRPPVWIWAAAAVFAFAALTPLVWQRTADHAPAVARTEEAKAAPAATPEPGVLRDQDRALPESEKLAAKPAARNAEAPAREMAPAAPPAPPAGTVTGRLQQRDEGRNTARTAPYPVQKQAGPYAQSQAVQADQAHPAVQAAAAEAPPAAGAPAVVPPLEESVATPQDKERTDALALKRERDEARRGGQAEGFAYGEAAKDQLRYRQLIGRRAASPEEARQLQREWQAFAVAYPIGARADEARVRSIEAMALAFHLGGDPRDREQARADAEAYLARPDAAQAARVRAVLSRLD